MIKLLLCLFVFILTSAFIYFISYKIKNFISNTDIKSGTINIIKFLLLYLFKEENEIKLKILCAIFLYAISFFVIKSFIISVPAGLAGFFLPSYIKKKTRQNYIEKFDSGFTDVMTIISSALRAGSSFVQGLEVAKERTREPLKSELTKTINEIKLGIPVHQALNNLGERVNSTDLSIFITTVNITRETGGNLSEILDTMVETIRERRKLKGKISALTAQGRISGYVIGSMPFILTGILYFLAPEMIKPMFQTTLGQIMMGIVIIFVGVGLIFINKIVSVDI